MSRRDETAYLLQCFDGDISRRAILKSLVAAGAGVATLTRFAHHLAEASGAEVAELTIFAWPGLVPDILKERSLAPFAKAHPKVNVKLDVSTNAVMYPKMLAAKTNPAISGGMFNDIFVQRDRDGLWVKLNDAWMPNRKNVPGELMPPGGYGTIFQFTPFGIKANPDKVEKPKSGRSGSGSTRAAWRWDVTDAYIAAADVRQGRASRRASSSGRRTSRTRA